MKIIDNKKINVHNLFKVILFIMILFPFIQQRTMQEFPNWLVNLYKMWCLASSCIIFLIIIIKDKKCLFSKDNLPYYLFGILYVFSTIMRAPGTLSWVIYNIFILTSLVLFVIIYSKEDLETLLFSLSIIYGLFIVLNNLLYLFFPNGIYETGFYHTGHLLGDDNALIYVILPGIIIQICYQTLFKKKLSVILLFEIITSLYIFFKMWAAASIVSFTLFVILILLQKKIERPKPMTYFIIVIFIIFIMFFGFSHPSIQSFIVNVLHKDPTLSYRTIIWRKAFNYISIKPLLGYGGYFSFGLFSIADRVYYPCHTPYLQLLIDGGFLLLLCFAVIIFNSYKNVNKHFNLLYSRYLTIGLSCMLINYISEYAGLLHVFIITALMINSPKYIMEDNLYENERKIIK